MEITPLRVVLANWPFEGPNMANLWSLIWGVENLINVPLESKFADKMSIRPRNYSMFCIFLTALLIWTP